MIGRSIQKTTSPGAGPTRTKSLPPLARLFSDMAHGSWARQMVATSKIGVTTIIISSGEKPSECVGLWL